MLKSQLKIRSLFYLLFFFFTIFFQQNLVAQCQEVLAIIDTSNPMANSENIIAICQGEELMFSGVGEYPENNTNYLQSDATSIFVWNFGDGNVDTSKQVTHIYNNPGGYEVTLTIIDVEGCTSTNQSNVFVELPADASIVQGEFFPDTICQFDTIVLSTAILGSPEAETADLIVHPGISGYYSGISADTVFLPDGVGVEYNSPIEINFPNPNLVINNPEDFGQVCITIEHSWFFDLDIILTCPDSTTLILKKQDFLGLECYLGEPIDEDSGNPLAGVGYEYCFELNENLLTMTEFVVENEPTTLPEGSYAVADSIENILGCPVNGIWTLSFMDHWGGDNGVLFGWNIKFGSNVDPDQETFVPVVDSLVWEPNDNNILGQTANEVIIVPQSSGFLDLQAMVYQDSGCVSDLTTQLFVTDQFDSACYNGGLISGIMFFDANQNGLRDINEVVLNGIPVSLSPEGLFQYPINEGHFSFAVDEGTYNVSAQSNNDWTQITSPLTYAIDISNNVIDTLKFGFYPTTPNGESIAGLNSNLIRCNRDVTFQMTSLNSGNLVNNGSLILVNHSPVESFSFLIDPDEQMGIDTFIWNFDNVYPTVSEEILFQALMPGEEFQNSLIEFEVISRIEDANTGEVNDDIFWFSQALLCAYDPNDKLVNPNREGDENYTLFDESLHYTIRFQNTGNDTAFNVTLVDTLDQNLNWLSFRPFTSSHDYQVELQNGVLTFEFENILLPDSTTNFDESQGFVSFYIDPIDGLAEETEIFNNAAIYFDLNSPIFTNTTLNTMVSMLPTVSVNESIFTEKWETKIYPNPSIDNFLFSVANGSLEVARLEILDLLGRIVDVKRIDLPQFLYKNEQLNSGVYVYRIVDENNVLRSTGKLIKTR